MGGHFKFGVRFLMAFTAAMSLCAFCMSFPTLFMAYFCQAMSFLCLCAWLTVAVAHEGQWRVVGVVFCSVFALYSLCSYGAMAGFHGEQVLPFFPQSLLQASYDAMFGVAPVPTRPVQLSDPFGSVEISVEGGQSLDSPYSRESFYTLGTLFIQMFIAGMFSFVAREMFRASNAPRGRL